jgi:hypothetical protein
LIARAFFFNTVTLLKYFAFDPIESV